MQPQTQTIRKPKSDRQRLAAIIAKCFPSCKHTDTMNELRHAVLSAKLGREIVKSAQITDNEVKSLLAAWEDWQVPFTPSQAGRTQIIALSQKYYADHGQEKLL